MSNLIVSRSVFLNKGPTGGQHIANRVFVVS